MSKTLFDVAAMECAVLVGSKTHPWLVTVTTKALVDAHKRHAVDILGGFVTNAVEQCLGQRFVVENHAVIVANVRPYGGAGVSIDRRQLRTKGFDLGDEFAALFRSE